MKKTKFDIVLAIILLSYFMILLDNSIIFTGTVKISEELQLNQLELSWVSNAYSLNFGGLLLLGARIGDIFGRKRVFISGLVIFAIGSLFVGLATNGLFIILARAFQGIGSAILAPTTLAMLMDNYKGEARIKAVAAYGATAGIGASVGLVIGGIFASALSWRVGFFINIPIAIIMVSLSIKYIKERQGSKQGSLDFLGAIASIIGISALVYSLVGESYNLLALIIAVVFIALFILQEARTQQPMMPLHLYTNPERLGAYIARFLYLGAMLSMWFLTPQIMQTQLGFTPLQAGVGFFPLTIINFLVALQVTRVTRKFGNTKLLTIGISLTALGMFFLSFFTAELGYWLGIASPMILLGFGQGLTLSPLTIAGISNTTPEDSGAASGVVNMVHQIGGSIGLSLVVAVSQNINGEMASYHLAMWTTTTLLILSLLVILFLVVPSTKYKEKLNQEGWNTL